MFKVNKFLIELLLSQMPDNRTTSRAIRIYNRRFSSVKTVELCQRWLASLLNTRRCLDFVHECKNSVARDETLFGPLNSHPLPQKA
jgi:hypothetical protein